MGALTRHHEIFGLVFYASVLLVALSTMAATWTQYPLIPFNVQSLHWSNAWLLATLVDYYGACFCFCGVIVSTEESWIASALWVLACCTIGSPACCLYVFLWLTKEGSSMRLERNKPLPLTDCGLSRSDNTAITRIVDEEAQELRRPKPSRVPSYDDNQRRNHQSRNSQPQHDREEREYQQRRLYERERQQQSYAQQQRHLHQNNQYRHHNNRPSDYYRGSSNATRTTASVSTGRTGASMSTGRTRHHSTSSLPEEERRRNNRRPRRSRSSSQQHRRNRQQHRRLETPVLS